MKRPLWFETDADVRSNLSSKHWRAGQQLRIAIENAIDASDRAFKKSHPRSDEPWKLAEDRRLLRLHARHVKKEHGIRLWLVIAMKLGRTTSAVQCRFSALRAGARVERTKQRRRI